jgi:hypothetical protein
MHIEKTWPKTIQKLMKKKIRTSLIMSQIELFANPWMVVKSSKKVRFGSGFFPC